MHPRSLSDRFVSFAFSVLLACGLLYLAVCLIRSIWPWLLGGGLVVAIAAGVVLLIRRHRERW